MANGLLDPPPAMQGALATDQRLPPGVDRPKGFWRMMGDWARRQPPPQFGGPTIDLKDRGAVDWMRRQRENLNRIQRYGEQHQMIWPGVAADAGTGLLDLVQGTHTGVMTPEAVMGLLDLGTIGVKPPGALGAMALRRGAGALPTDEAARMARAQEMGFDVETPLFHGTSADITSFVPSTGGSATGAKTGKMAIWLTDDPVTAGGYARHAATDAPVKKILREADEAADKGNWDLHEKKIVEAEILEKQIGEEGGLRGQNILPLYAPKDDEFRSIWDKAGELPSGLFVKDMKGRSFDDFGVSDEIQQTLSGAKRDGHKGVKFKNLDDAIGLHNRPATHVAIFDPKDIRSRFAQFDPAKSGSSNLLAAGGKGGLLSAGLLHGARGRLDEKISTRHGVEIDLSERPEGIVISKIVAPEPGTKSGTRAMQDIIDEADRRGVPVALTPSTAFGGNKKRLEDFYKGLGFVPNKGRNKNFMFKETMIRPPRGGQ